MKYIFISLTLSFATLMANAQSLNDAKTAIDAEQYQKAKNYLLNLEKTQSENPEITFFLGNVYFNLEEENSAKVVFERGVAKFPKAAINYVGLGACALAQDSLTAQKYFAKALELSKKKELTPMYIGLAYKQYKKYAKALEYFKIAATQFPKEADVYLHLGETYFGLGENSEAVNNYDRALVHNTVLLRALVDRGMIWKLALNFDASESEFRKALQLNPSYGPAYRELAETYLRWGNMEVRNYDTKVNQALDFYKKYLDNTDLSVESRMRYADFLVLAKKYKDLETEANSIAKMEDKNPRIYRYLGYAAYENGNYADAEQALHQFFTSVSEKRIIARDYYYLGEAEVKLGKDSVGTQHLQKAVEMDSSFVVAFGLLAKDQYKSKQYLKAAQSYEYAIRYSRKESLSDKFSLGMSYFWAYNNQVYQNTQDSTFVPNKTLLEKADSAFHYINEKSPTTTIAYYYRAKVARFREQNAEEGLAIPFYQKYLEVLESKPEEKAKSNTQIVEAYNYFGQQIINKDRVKALEYFNKVKAIDPNNAIANQAITALTAPPVESKPTKKAKK